MPNVKHRAPSFNTLPLFQAARDREFRALSYAERKLAKEFSVDPHIARLLAAQAYGSGGRR
jgi:hypothetical protein